MQRIARKDIDKEKKRQDIILIAEKLFISRGYDSAAMEDIAKEAGLATGTLYLYFKSKEELYVAIALRGARLMNEMAAAADKSATKGMDRTNAIVRAMHEFHRLYPDYSRAFVFASSLKLGPESKAMSDEIARAQRLNLILLRKAIDRGIEDGTIRKSVDSKKASILLVQALQSVIVLPPGISETLVNDGMTHDELVEYSLILLRRSIEKKQK